MRALLGGALVLCSSLLVTACSGTDGGPSGGAQDAASAQDAGSAQDVGSGQDAGTQDAGSGQDAGSVQDVGGTQDAGGAQDAGSALCPGGGAPVATKAVTVKNNSFDPPCISIAAGENVKWTNTGMASHTVTSDTGAPVTFDSGALGSGGTFELIFASPGVVGYHCIPHVALGMKGTVIVE
jgi:plastocyanin